MKRGEIYYADLSPVIGSEQGGLRPVLIIQNDVGNRHSPTTIVAAITSKKEKAEIPTHVKIEVDGLNKKSMVLLEQIRTIDKSRVQDIANFLGSHFLDASKIILTDQLDRLILDSHGGFINCCPDQNLCKDILEYLVPIQMGHQDAEEFLMITRDEFNEYGRWEEEQVTMAEMSMG